MLGNIIEVVDNIVIVELAIDIAKQPNIVGLHVVFEDNGKRIVGEIISVNKTVLKANIVGEFVNNTFNPGITNKPSFNSSIRVVTIEELSEILGPQDINDSNVYIGTSNIYQNYKINIDINKFFSNHFSIIGNSGSGKSYTIASLFQRMFSKENPPIGSNIFLFDAYGEYTKAFTRLNEINSNLNYKTYTTNVNSDDDIIKLPLWLLDVDDLALLLNVTTPNQLPILEKTLKLVPIISGDNPNAIKHKNDIIARALQDVLLSGDDSTKIRDQVTAILTKFYTEELNLDSTISQPGYTRTLKQCLYIDKTGKMQEMELVVNFINNFIFDDLKIEESYTNMYYTLNDLEKALEFALISEGMFKSNRVYDLANVLLVRLHNLANSNEKIFFSYPEYVTRENYIMELLTAKNNGKCQIVNFNISYIDDRLAKTITKIISRLLFKQAVSMDSRGRMPYHIVIEEAHRYVQKDTDSEILGYNIFDRITKEGRKYGVILGFITQRPSELSETAISQCSNFMILKMSHPKDLAYIKSMVPNVTEDIVEKIKNLKPGNCIAFGMAFKIPVNIQIAMPNPEPLSNNVDIVKCWSEVISLSSSQAIINNTVNEIGINEIRENNNLNSNPNPNPNPNPNILMTDINDGVRIESTME